MKYTQGVKLYRALVNYRRSLTLTDKEYFLRRVRFEFERNRFLTEPGEIVFQEQKAKSFLENKRLV